MSMISKLRIPSNCHASCLMRWRNITTLEQTTAKASEVDNVEWDNALPYHHIPGPSRYTLIRQFMKGGKYHGLQIVDMHRALRSDYGQMVRIPGLLGRSDTVLTFDPRMFEKVFRTEGAHPKRRGIETFTYYRKKVRPEVFGETGGLISEHGAQWFAARSKINPVMLQPKTVKMYVDKVDGVAKDMRRKVRALRNADTLEMPSDFGNELNKWALESIGVIALDDRLGALMNDTAEGRQIIELVKNFFVLTYELDVAPSVWKYYKTPQFKKLMSVFDQMTALIMKYVDRAVVRLDQTNGSSTDAEDRSILEKLLKIDRRIAVVMAFDMLLAGVDTTSAAVISCLYHLAKNPGRQARLREEIERVLPDKDAAFTTTTLNSMVYLKACFKEALRMNPVIAGNARGTGKDIVLGGYQIPKGTEVAMATVVLQTEDANFPNANEFIPERWLKEAAATSECPSARTTHPFVYLPFGFGPRSCIGRRFAEMEVEVLLIRLLQEFRIEYHYGPLKYHNSLILSPDEDVKFKFIDI